MRGFLIFFSFIILAIMVSKSFAHTKGGLQKKHVELSITIICFPLYLWSYNGKMIESPRTVLNDRHLNMCFFWVEGNTLKIPNVSSFLMSSLKLTLFSCFLNPGMSQSRPQNPL